MEYSLDNEDQDLNYYLGLKESLPKTYVLRNKKIENRLDFYYYNPKFQALEKLLLKIKTHRTLSDLEKSNLIIPTSRNIVPADSPDSLFSYISISNVDVKDDIGTIVDYDTFRGDQAPSRARQLIKEGDFIISTVRPTRGAVFLATKSHNNFVCSTGFAILRIDKSLNSNYIAEIFRSDYVIDQIERMQAGTEYPAINKKSDLRKIILMIPDKSKQDSIVDRIEKIKLKRAKLLYDARRLEENTKNEFLETRNLLFDSILAKNNHSDNLKDKIYVVKRVALRDRIDHEWYRPRHYNVENRLLNTKSVKKIKEIRKKIRYGVSISADYFTSGIQFLRIENISNENLNLDDIKFISEDMENKVKSSYLEEGDILISRSGTIGIAIVIPKSIGRLSFGSYILRLTLKDKNEVNPIYVSEFINSYFGRIQIERNTTGSNQLNITIPALESMLIPIPRKEIQNEIAQEIIKAREKLKTENEQVRVMRLEAEKILRDERRNIIFWQQVTN